MTQNVAASRPPAFVPEGHRSLGPDNPVLASKFAVPEPPQFVVSRPRLLDRLSEGAGQPLTVVTGPAGSGKTQLLAAWVRTRPPAERAVWITLEKEDDDWAPAFWTYVVEGLRRAAVPLPTLDNELLVPVTDRAFPARLAADLASQPARVVLVLDGVSHLTDPQWAMDLDFVLRHSADRLRLVLVGRWDPPLPLHRYRLAGRLSELRSADLAFTEPEAAEVLALHGVSLTLSALGSLLHHTEGWAAGLRLFAMALEGRTNAEHLVASITGDEANIAEYFAGEVLRSQPPDVRSFLLTTSILDTFTPELAQAVTGRADARRVLTCLERRNAFVQPVDEAGTVYRFHRLFAELLRAQLACDEAGQLPELHRRAAQWYVNEGRTVDAVRHAAAAGDWTAAATMAVADYSVGRLVLHGRRDALGASFGDLPEDVDSAESAMVAAALALAGARPDRSRQLLARAQQLLADRGGDCEHASVLTAAALETLVAHALHDYPQVLESAPVVESLMAQAPDRLAEHPELRVLVLAAKGSAQSWDDRLDEAVATLTEAATLAAATAGCEYPAMDCRQELALVEAYRGHLDRALSLATQALDPTDRYPAAARPRPATADVALAWVAGERYDVESAWRHLKVADPKRSPPTGGPAGAGAAVVKARLLQARGDMRGALNVLSEAEKQADTEEGARAYPRWLVREITLSRARILTAIGRVIEARTAIRRLGEPHTTDVAIVLAAASLADGDGERARRVVSAVMETADVTSPVLVEAWLVMAAVEMNAGAAERARQALRQAFRVAALESQRRAFHQAGPRLRQLLREDEDLAKLYRLLHGSAAPRHGQRPKYDRDNQAEAVIVDTLSKREMEVLQQLAAMLPTEEIAASMYVSVNTIKTHVRSILRKLSASRRNEAVRRARSLGLL
jgi:LuxR family maltose regulon positive regulatory protein